MSRSRPETFEDLLELFRMQEQPEQVIPLIDDVRLQKLVSIWPMARLEPRRPGRARPVDDSPAAGWDWLWEQREVDMDDLARQLGISPVVLRRTLDVARGCRLVYPDGTANQYAVQYLRARIARELGAGARRERRSKSA